MQEYYYHWHPKKYLGKDIITAGEYDNLLYQIDKYSNSDKYYLEIIFEQFRQTYHDQKPSRLDSIFLLLTEKDAFIYKKHIELKEKNHINVIYIKLK